MWSFGTQNVPLRYQGTGSASGSFFQPTFENNAMYLADPTQPEPLSSNMFIPHSQAAFFSFEEAVKQNPQIRKYSPVEIQIGEVIGSGFFGQVHKGLLNTGQIVAIKRVLKQRFRDKNDAQMFAQEIEILSKVSHPYIVAFYGIALLDDNSYTMVMEFMSGGTLRGIIDKYPHALHNERKVSIAKRIADAMNYLHSWKPQPILHRDLSSLNILVDNNVNPKICDFGLSRFKPAENTSMTTAVGGCAWMAPEVWHSGNYDQKADVYSYGIVCWELCTGGDPYCGIIPDVYASRVALEGLRPPLPDNLPSDWRCLICACWSNDPRQRPDFAQILHELSK